jgi:hypothetical protein
MNILPTEIFYLLLDVLCDRRGRNTLAALACVNKAFHALTMPSPYKWG